MRLALYHNLPSGGAYRALYEYSTRLAQRHSVDLYRLDGENGGADADETHHRDQERTLEGGLNAVYVYEMSGGRGRRAPRSAAERVVHVRRLTALQAEVAGDIDRRGYDAVVVHPCRITQTPALLWMLRTPTVYYMQEPRRTSFEYDLRPHPQLSGPTSVARWAGRTIAERQFRSIDEKAARAGDLILANSYYSVESIYRAYGREAVFCLSLIHI